MLSTEAMEVLKARYLGPGENPDDLFRRVAKHVAQAEKGFGRDEKSAAEAFYTLMSSLEFLPNSPTLMNAGKNKSQLAACFVLPIEDSLEQIFETLKSAALIHQSGGGTGFSFSRLRPKGDRVAATGGQASGPVSFLHVFDMAAQVVKQGAVRSGANMAVLRVDHPDIEDFIAVKAKPDVLNHFNLSVGITDHFIKAVEEDAEFSLVNPHENQIVRTVRASIIFERIIHMAWENGEPGMFFLDTVNRANPTPALGFFESPNPCSEQPLLPYESCVLGSINLVRMVRDCNGIKLLDYEKFKQVIRTAVRFLDDVVEVNCYPLEKVAQASRLTRKIGLGIMGLADVFILLDIPYASIEAVQLTETIMRFITSEARQMSWELAVERGAFPAFAGSTYDYKGTGLMRNATVTTIAPTGSISLIAGCSSGIEPLFALALTRRVLEGRRITSISPVVLQYLEEKGKLGKQIETWIQETGSVQAADLPDNMKRVLATAHEILPEWHVAHLASAQRYTDNGVSKTVNLPANASCGDIRRIFMHAHRAGCKGITVYRDGSRGGQVLNPGIFNCNDCET